MRAARVLCPTSAVQAAADEEFERAEASPASYAELAAGAERVRWSLDEIPWGAVDPARAPAELRLTVREMAFSESATYSATQRFLEATHDDLELSQWISVWFYEETRHPHVLLEWLRRVGEHVSPELVVKGRVSTPFMRSKVGTLVTNVISEVIATRAYQRLAREAPEPVLAEIARRISGDEARHAASFFRFARAALAASENAGRDRARGLEVLQAWLESAATHPVAQMIDRLRRTGREEALPEVRARVVRVVGLLLGLPLRSADEVPRALREQLQTRCA